MYNTLNMEAARASGSHSEVVRSI